MVASSSCVWTRRLAFSLALVSPLSLRRWRPAGGGTFYSRASQARGGLVMVQNHFYLLVLALTVPWLLNLRSGVAHGACHALLALSCSHSRGLGCSSTSLGGSATSSGSWCSTGGHGRSWRPVYLQVLQASLWGASFLGADPFYIRHGAVLSATTCLQSNLLTNDHERVFGVLAVDA